MAKTMASKIQIQCQNNRRSHTKTNEVKKMGYEFFRYKGSKYVEITCDGKTLILLYKQFVDARIRAQKHLKQSEIMGGIVKR